MRVRLFCAAIALLFIQPISAQESANQKCSDDAGRDRCSEIALAKTRDKYGLEDATTLADQGTYLRRAMIVDGYGRDVLAVSFAREKGKDPYVDIRAAKVEGSKESRYIRMLISESDWNRTNAKSRYFDRDFVPKPTNGDGIDICLHGWMASVEVANPARLSLNALPADMLEPEIKSKTQSTCTEGLAVEYAYQLVDLAHEMIPVCKSIPLDTRRNTAIVLNTCLSLSGDRGAAGQAVKLSHAINRAQSIFPKDAAQTQKALAGLVVFADPNNRLKPGHGRITQSRRAEMVDLLAQGKIYLRTYDGIDADHVRIEGIQVQDSADPDVEKRPERKITLLASRELGEFRIKDIEISPFRQ
jgi:hypothetical protein